ncbi:hypothetical protein AF336_07640 [Bradyrhizobium diazoefficiens]|nr:hypothetical protein BD122_26160 [Bradyrhizobium diazoefficiens]KOY10818.1 hypothetical protein AF336_07640 [Bradyrhizobium diazoefficiens]
MAMILSLRRKAVVRSCGAYIGAFARRQATAKTRLPGASPQAAPADPAMDYRDFIEMNPI